MTEAIERDSMYYDVVIVGAGPSGLSAAIHLKQLAAENQRDISVCIIDKGSEIGAHILSGAVIDPKALNELIPDWQHKGAPLTRSVSRDRLLYMSESKAYHLPVPPSFHNKGNYIISLGQFCRWLAQQAEELGVEIYPGFAASEVLYHDNGAVKGVLTGDMGIDKEGRQTSLYQPGMALLARQTIFAEGCRGSLTKTLLSRFNLTEQCEPQTYGIGIKEVWEVSPEQGEPGSVIHTVGWPLNSKTYGGSFIYHLDNNKIALGFVIGLDYQNPYLSPFEELQRFKTHPYVRSLLTGGRRIAYGARALSEGGWQSLPKLTFPGGVLVGDTAGFLNVPRIKGIHMAMKSAMLAAKAVFAVLPSQASPAVADEGAEAKSYTDLFKQSWLARELYRVRNIRPSFKWGLFGAFAYGAVDEYIFRGKAPWTLKHHGTDAASLKKARDCQPIDYPKPDGQLTFDRLSSVVLAGVNHTENQPVHLQLKNPALAIEVNYQDYASPETRYCPAAVYEIVMNHTTAQPHLQINAQNCIHCKTCDIKDPLQNINWTCPEGGGGPNYAEM